MLRSKYLHVDLRPNVDSDKNYFLNELLKLLAHGERYFRKRQFIELYNAGLAIAFLCVQTMHYTLACKVYSLFGQILLSNNFADLAEKMYNKLRSCAHTAQDPLIKLFAFKQLGYTYI